MQVAKELFAIFAAIIALIPQFEDGTTPGTAKRQMAVAAIRKILDDPSQPLNFPKFLSPWEDLLLGLMVDGTVAVANRSGFFTKPAASSPNSPQP